MLEAFTNLFSGVGPECLVLFLVALLALAGMFVAGKIRLGSTADREKNALKEALAQMTDDRDFWRVRGLDGTTLAQIAAHGERS